MELGAGAVTIQWQGWTRRRAALSLPPPQDKRGGGGKKYHGKVQNSACPEALCNIPVVFNAEAN